MKLGISDTTNTHDTPAESPRAKQLQITAERKYHMRLPHWLQLALAFLGVAITWVIQQTTAGNLTLPAVAITVLTALNTTIGLFTDSVQGASDAKRGLAAAGKALVVLALLGLVGASQTACTPAQSATIKVDFAKVEQVILDGLKNGQDLHLIELAVGALVPHGADVDAIINEAIQLLHDTNVIPPDVLPAAQARQAEIAGKALGAHFRVSP